MESPTKLNPVQEDYLMAVSHLKQQKPHVSIARLAQHLRTHLSLVHAAVRGLVNTGLLKVSVYHGVGLSSEGRIRVTDILRRRTALVDALAEAFQLDRVTAQNAADNLRRALSRSDVNRIMCSRCWRHQQGVERRKVVRGASKRAVVTNGSS